MVPSFIVYAEVCCEGTAAAGAAAPAVPVGTGALQRASWALRSACIAARRAAISFAAGVSAGRSQAVPAPQRRNAQALILYSLE